MERIHLYRGKRLDNGQFIEGSLIGEDVIVGKIVDFEEDYFTTEFWYKVDPETVGQFTGMTDKNGKPIFEGDRGMHKLFGDVYVKYLIQECAFVYVSKDSDHRMGHRNAGSGYTCDVNFEVLGTIHDNKELLK